LGFALIAQATDWSNAQGKITPFEIRYPITFRYLYRDMKPRLRYAQVGNAGIDQCNK